MNYRTRFARLTDEAAIFDLYREVAKIPGGIAREADEISPAYVAANLQKSLKNGVSLVVEDPNDNRILIAEAHCYLLEPRVFKHVLSELTIVVHPGFQGQGLGRLLFVDLLKHVEEFRTDILRIELIARESNKKAIDFYLKIGFTIEGRFEKRIDTKTGAFEADIPMAWFNPRFNV
ncbi:GNAT family N-acetyltransferase [Larkinella terrae]|uniref:GNAT family N-acetyltransferase n=1 Tax=Larkinella terrae TaxID=2025311 RepID=A0A7K0ELM9_9BACT|nr:GNAT family N-acetyltransferase [Larkinella terrae]MRS62737.1 GNAT family N-acetyltransferase [Larkinella terrae]